MPRRGCLGCSFPLIIGISVALLALFVVGVLSGPLGGEVLPWFSVPKPYITLPAEEVFHLFGFPITNTIIAAWLTIIVLVGISYAATRRLKLIPTRFQTAFEIAIGALLNFCQRVAGEENGRRFFPIVATIFLFVIMNAWLSLLPGFGSITITGPDAETVALLRGPNTDINFPLALALVSFVAVGYFGMRLRGAVHYLGEYVRVGQFVKGWGQLFTGKLRAGIMGLFQGAIDIFIGALELISHLIRIISFTFRLFGNMTAAKTLILSATFLIPWVFPPIFYGLELLIGFIQALIFAGLTLVFLTIAVAPHGEAHS